MLRCEDHMVRDAQAPKNPVRRLVLPGPSALKHRLLAAPKHSGDNSGSKDLQPIASTMQICRKPEQNACSHSLFLPRWQMLCRGTPLGHGHPPQRTAASLPADGFDRMMGFGIFPSPAQSWLHRGLR